MTSRCKTLTILHGRGVISTSLPIESTLIFQPAPVTRYTSHFLAVEIGDRVVCARTTWIDPVLFYPLKEAALFDDEFL